MTTILVAAVLSALPPHIMGEDPCVFSGRPFSLVYRSPTGEEWRDDAVPYLRVDGIETPLETSQSKVTGWWPTDVHWGLTTLCTKLDALALGSRLLLFPLRDGRPLDNVRVAVLVDFERRVALDIRAVAQDGRLIRATTDSVLFESTCRGGGVGPTRTTTLPDGELLTYGDHSHSLTRAIRIAVGGSGLDVSVDIGATRDIYELQTTMTDSDFATAFGLAPRPVPECGPTAVSGRTASGRLCVRPKAEPGRWYCSPPRGEEPRAQQQKR